MPATEPWIVPETAGGRETLIRLVEQYERDGKARELGIALTHLANLVKQIRTGRDQDHAMAIAGQLASRAVGTLRQTDDKSALAAALRSLAGAFVFGLDREELLREALQLTREGDDTTGEGWTLFAMAAFPKEEGKQLLNEARLCFARTGDSNGLAHVSLRWGVQNREHGRILEAAESFAATGNDRLAEEAYVMAEVFGDGLHVDEREALLVKALGHAARRNAPSRQILILNNLVKLMKKAKRKDAAKRYSGMAAALNDHNS